MIERARPGGGGLWLQVHGVVVLMVIVGDEELLAWCGCDEKIDGCRE